MPKRFQRFKPVFDTSQPITVKCKQCKLQFLQTEGMFRTLNMRNNIFQKFFFCFKCWEAYGNQLSQKASKYHNKTGNKDDIIYDWNAIEDQYKKSIKKLVDMEWAEECRKIEDRLKNWTIDRLTSQGYCKVKMAAKKTGKVLDKKRLQFTCTSRSSLSVNKYMPNQFSNGDEVTICRTDPLKDLDVYKAEVEFVLDNCTTISVLTKTVPYDISQGTWRIDAGANKTSYERQVEALGYLCSQKNEKNVSPLIRQHIFENYLKLLDENNRNILMESSSMDHLNTYKQGSSDTQQSSNYVTHFNEPTEKSTRRFEQCLEKVDSSVFGRLNESQRTAVTDNIYKKCFISLIHGPPGTGKTTTIATLIHDLVIKKKKEVIQGPSRVKKFQILTSADSNVAVDELLKRLLYNNTESKHNLSVIRIGSCTRIDQGLQQYSLNFQLENHAKMTEINDYRQRLDTIQEDLKNLTGADKGFAFRDRGVLANEIKRLQSDMTEEILNKADVVCSTLVGCGSDALKGRKFPIIVIDEATQATEPRSLIAIQKLENSDSSKIILVGDQNQLPPTVLCKEAEDKGLKISLFDRIVRNKNEDINYNMLQIQYRMHPVLRAFPSKEFYDNQLLDGKNCLSSNLDMSKSFDMKKFPLIYIDTSGQAENNNSDDILKPLNETDRKERDYSDSGSKYNRYEIDLIKHILLNDIKNNGAVNNTFDIGVITPYTAQVKELRKALWNDNSKDFYKNCEIKTIDGFQGREKDLIIFSCVRTNQIGFLKDYRRLNVAITRAKFGLIVIGNSVLLQQDPVWSRFLSYMRCYDKLTEIQQAIPLKCQETIC